MFKFYIDEVLLETEPIGWPKFSINIIRDTDAQALVVQHPLTLTFIGDGWAILKDKFDEPNGYCEDFDLRIEKSCVDGFKTIVRAKIFISQTEFNLNKCEAESQIEDNSFFARIFNNKSLPVKIDIDVSKNDVAITATPTFDLTLFDPATGLDLPDTREAYDIKDVFTFFTQWMSDGELGFRSDFIDNLPDDESGSILKGTELRTHLGTDSAITISFEDLFDVYFKEYNLLMTIETDSDGSVFLRIEDDEFFFGAANSLELTAIDDMTESVLQDELFSSVKFGSAGSGTTGTFPQITFLSWNNEEFIVSGQCNTDRELNLEVNAVTNSNVIEDIFGGDDSFDDDLVLIQYTKSTARATKTNPEENTPADTIYNEEYLNSVVSARYDLQGSITKFIGDGDDGFLASNTVSDSFNVPAGGFIDATTPFEFDDDFTPPNNDPNGNYSIVAFEYISPLSGLYTFNSTALYRWNTLNAPNGTIRIRIERFDAGGGLISSTIVRVDNQFTVNPAPNTPYSTSGVPINFNLIAGEKVRVRYEAATGGLGAVDGDIEFIAGCTFEALATANGGGLFEEKDIDDYRVIGVSFDRFLDAGQIEDLINQPFKAVIVDHDGVTKKNTFINNVSINAYNGITNWQMIRNINNA